jgi:uncharacterized BrkB/YihY/UPF0761 family membrane protein
VVFLTWLYLSAYIVLMGGEMNSELERQQAKEAGLPAEPAAAAEAAEPDSAPEPKRDPDRISWPMAAMGFVLARRSGR